jgi:uncharacterized membrane protein
MADEPVYLYLAVYATENDARDDWELVKELHRDHTLGTFDGAVITKNETGWVHVDKYEKPTQHGAWTGIAVGAALGILFPPSIPVTAAAGGLVGGLVGHFWKGMSRKDVKELGDLLDEGEAALLIVGESALQSYVEKALPHARRHVALEVDMESHVLRETLAQAAREMEEAK